MSPSIPVPEVHHPGAVTAKQDGSLFRKRQAIRQPSTFQGQVHAVCAGKMYPDLPGDGRHLPLQTHKFLVCVSIPSPTPATPKMFGAAGPIFISILPKVSKSLGLPLPLGDAATTFLKLLPQVAFSLHPAEKIEN